MRKIKRQTQKPKTCFLNPETFKGSVCYPFSHVGLKVLDMDPIQIHYYMANQLSCSLQQRTRLETQAWKGFGS